MVPFSMELPVKVYFGRDTFRNSLEKEKGTLGDRVFVVTTGGSLKKSGYLDELTDVLRNIAEDICIYDRISPEPELDEIRNAVDFGKGFEPASVVGFGGGSAIDAAKAVACGLACREKIEYYYYHDTAPEASLPVVAVPTTAGTGSELSRGAVITDKKTRQKKGIRGVNLYPKAAVVDSWFTEKIPYKITMETGFDVFAHAVESYVAVKACRFSRMLSLEAVKLAGENLARLADDLDDARAREKMSYASMIMGINLGNTGTGLPHRMQYPVGAATGTSHAAGLLALYPAWLEYEYRYSAGKLNRAAGVLCGRECSSRAECLGGIMKFIDRLGVRKTLGELGVTDEILGRLAGEVTGNMENDPAYAEHDIVNKIYKQAYKS